MTQVSDGDRAAALGRLFDRLMAVTSLEDMPTSKALNQIGVLTDIAGDLGKTDGTARALAWAEAVRGRKLSRRHAVLLEYFTANAWDNHKRARHGDVDVAWQWEQPEVLEQIFHLRRAVSMPGFLQLSPLRRCQIYTNLGNQLSTLGRTIDARTMWARALRINPRFGMARGNRGSGLVSYAESLYDRHQQRVLLCFAHDDLSAALTSGAQFRGDNQADAKAYFAERKAIIERFMPVDRIKRALKLNNGELGKTSAEQRYRRWALHEGLFLNPLNDLGAYPAAACDTLSLPSHTTALKKPPTLIGFFNQIKQEYVSARWFLYQGLHDEKPHFSDRGVTLYNTLDYPSYGLALESVKAGYRLAYSLFDKIAYFLNDYVGLGQNPRQVYFRTIWYQNRDPSSGIRPQLDKSRNAALRGLFWLAKDIFEHDLKDVMEPEAQSLDAIRNQLEHGYLKVHDISLPKQTSEIEEMWTDTLAYSVQRSDLEEKAIHVLRLARSAIIYLALGMHIEERNKATKGEPGPTLPMSLPIYSDGRKA